MPTLAIFDGIKIQVFNDEHPPPHFHVAFAEHRASILIDTLELHKGHMPRQQLRKVRAWAVTRKDALHKAWSLCLADQNPGKIP